MSLFMYSFVFPQFCFTPIFSDIPLLALLILLLHPSPSLDPRNTPGTRRPSCVFGEGEKRRNLLQQLGKQMPGATETMSRLSCSLTTEVCIHGAAGIVLNFNNTTAITMKADIYSLSLWALEPNSLALNPGPDTFLAMRTWTAVSSSVNGG